MPRYVEIRDLTAAEKECEHCTLPICDDRSAECRYVQISGRVPLDPQTKLKRDILRIARRLNTGTHQREVFQERQLAKLDEALADYAKNGGDLDEIKRRFTA